MQRASHIIGKPVVSADSGEKLGTVDDLLVDEKGSQLVGLVVRQGWRHSEQVLPAASVQTFGRDAVVTRSSADLVGAKQWTEDHKE